MATTQRSDQLREYLWLLRRRKWEIILVAALTLAAALAITLTETKIYEGKTKVLVNAVQSPNSASGPQTPDLPTEEQVVKSSAVATAVIKRRHLNMSQSALLQGVNAAPVAGTTSVLAIAYDSSSPTFAAKAAQAFANSYARFRNGSITRAYQSALASAEATATTLRKNIASIDRSIGHASAPGQPSALQGQRDTLVAQLGVVEQQISSLQGGSATNQNNAAEVIQSATVPTSPVRPQKIRNGILALIGGILLGTMVALFRHRLDIRFTGPRDFEEELQAPVFGSVPRVPGWRRPEDSLVLLKDPQAPVAETYRTLATNLRYTAKQHGTKVILVTSAVRAEGKSTIAANLGVAIAQAGERVLLASADLRRPRLHRIFDIDNAGIAEVVSGSSTLAEVLRDTEVENLLFVGSGPAPRDPAALLSSRRMSQLIDEFRAVQCDLVLVDCPPLLAVADPSILAPYADGVLYVVDGRQTTRSVVAQARDQLRNAGASIIGGVYNNFDLHTTYPGDYYQSDAYEPLAPEQEYVGNGKAGDPVHPPAPLSR